MEIYDEKHGSVITSVQWLTPSSYSDSGNGSDYVKTDASFKAIISDNGADYESQI